MPFVLHVMDHGTVDPQRTGLFAGWLRRTFARRMRFLVPRAAQCLAIGEAMAEEYGRLYGRPFRHFQNVAPLDADSFTDSTVFVDDDTVEQAAVAHPQVGQTGAGVSQDFFRSLVHVGAHQNGIRNRDNLRKMDDAVVMGCAADFPWCGPAAMEFGGVRTGGAPPARIIAGTAASFAGGSF